VIGQAYQGVRANPLEPQDGPQSNEMIAAQRRAAPAGEWEQRISAAHSTLAFLRASRMKRTMGH